MSRNAVLVKIEERMKRKAESPLPIQCICPLKLKVLMQLSVSVSIVLDAHIRTLSECIENTKAGINVEHLRTNKRRG